MFAQWRRMIYRLYRKIISRIHRKRLSPYVELIRSYVMDNHLKTCSRRHPDVRIVTVEGFGEAYRHLLRICDQSRLTWRYIAGHYYYTATLPAECGQLVLTDNVGFTRDSVVAILKINVSELLPFVREIRYRTNKKEKL